MSFVWGLTIKALDSEAWGGGATRRKNENEEGIKDFITVLIFTVDYFFVFLARVDK